MSKELWTAVDQYINTQLAPSDDALLSAIRASDEAGLPQISVSPPQGKLLQMLAQSVDARSILEIGTLGGYSTIWLARALPKGGRLITLEREAKHAQVARSNIAHAGLSEIVDVREGSALETLTRMESEGISPFDFIFIDADKANIPDYFKLSLKMAHRGTLIIVDNVIRDGEIIDPQNAEPATVGVRTLYEMLASEKRVSATAIQTVGVKGYDGILIALVVSV